MAGARSMVVGSISAVDPHPFHRLCVDALHLFTVGLQRNPACLKPSRPMDFSSSFAGTRLSTAGPKKNQGRRRRRGSSSSSSRWGLVVVNEIAGQYEDGFEDVQAQLINYFTYKAVRTVLHQLYEMNPPKYTWFYNFVATNQRTTDGKRFLRTLGKEKQDLAERVMITRLHLYGKWIKKLDHAMMYQRISDENLELMRERLIETVIWPTDDTNTEIIG